MPDSFDPYLKWLAILPAEQPPNHYRLLALPLFVNDADVIENAADQRMAHVRTFRVGKHAELSQEILNEIAAAAVLLLDPEKKKAYDRQLRAERAALKQKRQGPTSAKAQRPKPRARKLDSNQAASNTEFAGIDVAPRESFTASRISRRRNKPTWLPAVIAVGAFVLLAGIGAAVMFSGSSAGPQVASREDRPQSIPDSRLSTSEKPPDKESQNPVDDPLLTDPRLPSGSTPQDNSEQPASDEPETTPEQPPFTFETTNNPPDPRQEDTPETNPAKQPGDNSQPPATVPLAEERLPVPAEASLAAKRAQITDLFQQQIEAARTKVDKAELAQQLFDAGRQTQDDPVGIYALHDAALKQAMEAGRIDLATDCIEALADQFDVDEFQLTTETLLSMARAVTDNDQRANAAQMAINLAEEAIQVDRFEQAEQLSKLAASASGRLRDLKLRKDSNSLRARLRVVKVAWEASEEAVALLADQPDNAEAHLARGKFLALLKQDWQEGLPHLTQGSDPALAELAKQEASSPAAVDARLALANAWYDWARRASGAEGEGGLVRALHWYQDVVGDLSAQHAAKANLRIEELSEIVKPPKSHVARLSWVRGPAGLIREFKEHGGTVKTFDVSADGRYVLTGSTDHTLRICDLVTGEEKRIDTNADANPAVFMPDGGHVMVQDGWSNISLIDWKTEARKWRNIQIGRQRCIALLPDKSLALLIDSEATLLGWDYTTGKEVFRSLVPKDTYKMAVISDGRRVLLGQARSKLSIFDLTAGELLHELGPIPEHAWMTPSLSISPDGKWGLSASSVCPARLWNLKTGKLVQTLATDKPSSCDFSPDGQRVAISGVGKLDVWQLKTNTLVHSFSISQPAAGSVRFTPDGRGLISSGGSSGVVRLHRIADP